MFEIGDIVTGDGWIGRFKVTSLRKDEYIHLKSFDEVVHINTGQTFRPKFNGFLFKINQIELVNKKNIEPINYIKLEE